jgi:ABC-type uncharacterized transport system auxiliary subunit
MERDLQRRKAKGGIAVRNLSILSAIISILFISACGTMPHTSIYTIDIPVAQKEQRAEAEDPSLAIHVRSPRYLEQPYIASRTSPFALNLARYSKWDRPPDELVAEAVRDTLSKTGRFKEVEVYNSPPRNSYVVDVNLRKFERSDEAGISYALLSMDVILTSPDGEELYSEQFSYSEAIAGESFKNLAAELSQSLEEALNRTRAGVLEAMGE